MTAIEEVEVTAKARPTLRRRGGRDEALLRLVPKILGVICDEGQSSRLPSSQVAVLPTGIELCAYYLAPSRIVISVYSLVNDRIVKVFSAHTTERPELADPAFFCHAGGSVGLLSWRRGEWEDAGYGSRCTGGDRCRPDRETQGLNARDAWPVIDDGNSIPSSAGPRPST